MATSSRKRHQILEIFVPGVLYPVREQNDSLRGKRLDRFLVVGNQHDRAAVGAQEQTLAETRLWVLPNPSGLNAHWNAESLAEEFARLREAAG